MARVIYTILAQKDVCYQELGSRRVVDEEKQIKNLVSKLKSLGVEVNMHTHEKLELKVRI